MFSRLYKVDCSPLYYYYENNHILHLDISLSYVLASYIFHILVQPRGVALNLIPAGARYCDIYT
jgi:hypothetical protein